VVKVDGAPVLCSEIDGLSTVPVKRGPRLHGSHVLGVADGTENPVGIPELLIPSGAFPGPFVTTNEMLAARKASSPSSDRFTIVVVAEMSLNWARRNVSMIRNGIASDRCRIRRRATPANP
jgi:hypothetical protein